MSANKDININLSDLPRQLKSAGAKSVTYVPIIFFVVIALVYGFVLLRIGMLSSAAPTDDDVSSNISQLTPHIDKNAAHQLQSLEDHNVNVQTLFNQARGNPFGE
jgi:hypothetical protein